MSAVAHGWHKPGGGGPSREVAEEFHSADKRVGKWEHPRHGRSQSKHHPAEKLKGRLGY